jgi:DNA-3-methyladenine glycosylase I
MYADQIDGVANYVPLSLVPQLERRKWFHVVGQLSNRKAFSHRSHQRPLELRGRLHTVPLPPRRSLSSSAQIRCRWATDANPREVEYHDTEWAAPQHDASRLFELLSLEGAQAGLSWSTVLAKRPRYRAVFADFDAAKVAAFEDAEIEAILADPGVIRNRGKIHSVVNNARVIVALEQQGRGFSELVWSFATTGPRQDAQPAAATALPSQSPESAAMARTLRHLGFRFVGATTCYALMQAAGLVNDHAADCFRRAEISQMAKSASAG